MSTENKNNYNKYLQLTSIAFQMMIIMFIFVWLGRISDEYFNTKKSYFTALGSLLGLGVSLYAVLNQLKRMQ